jgi:O-antigen ligase
MVHDFIFNKAARRNKVLLILLAATSSLFILSLARSALLGLLVSALVFMVGLGGSSLKKAAPHVLRGAGLILIIALGFIILSGVASKHIHKTAINGSTSGVKGNLGIFGSHAVSVADESAQTRYSTWPKAIDYFKENPIKGIGAYNSRVRLNLEQYRKGAPDVNLQPFNNDFLGLLVDLGLIGVLAFGPLVAGVLVSLIKSFKRRWATPSAAYALASLAMLIQTNFFQSILLARLWVVTGIALAGIYSLPAKRKVST